MNPKNYNALLLVSIAYKKLKQFDPAIQNISAALQIEANYHAFIIRAKIY